MRTLLLAVLWLMLAFLMLIKVAEWTANPHEHTDGGSWFIVLLSIFFTAMVTLAVEDLVEKKPSQWGLRVVPAAVQLALVGLLALLVPSKAMRGEATALDVEALAVLAYFGLVVRSYRRDRARTRAELPAAIVRK